MRFALLVLSALLPSALLQAQSPSCSPCQAIEKGSSPRSHAVCLSGTEMASRIDTQKPVAPLNETHVRIHGTVVACVCFSSKGKVTQISILSGPAMVQQSVLDSLKDWTFRPVTQGGFRHGACGTLGIQVALDDGQMKTIIVN